MAEIAKITLKGESEAKNFIDEALRGDIAYEELSTTVSKTGGYVAGDHLIYLGQYYEVVADIAQGGTIVTSGAGQNVEEREVGDEIKKNKTQVVAQIQTLTNQVKDMNNVYGSKNLLPIDYPSSTKNGITFTVNDDGSITANGTATANAVFQLVNKSNFPSASWESLKDIISGKAVILNGCPSGGSQSTYLLRKWGQSTSGTYTDYGDGVEFAPTESSLTDYNWDIEIVIFSGQTVSNLTFYPMIRLASIEDDTYEPYAKTNQQLTQDSVTWDNLSEVGAVNLFNNTATSNPSLNGLSFIVNDDKSVTISGQNTSSGNTSLDTPNFKFGRSGTFKFTGNTGGSYSTYWLNLYDRTANVNYNVTSGSRPTIVTIDSTHTYVMKYLIGGSYSISGSVVMKPMISPLDYNGPYVPYAKTNQQLTKDTTALLDNTEVNGAVNIAPNNAVTQTASGATFTVNPDKTITQAGNVNAQTDILLGTTTLPKGTYTISDGIHDTQSIDATERYVVFIRNVETNLWIARSDGRDTIRQTFTLNADTKINMTLRVYSGYGDGNTYKPMITVPSYNGPYVPYAKSNKELTDVIDNVKDYYFEVDETAYGYSVTVNTDGVKSYKTLLNELATGLLAKAQALKPGEYIHVVSMQGYQGEWFLPLNTYFNFANSATSVNVHFRGLYAYSSNASIRQIAASTTLNSCTFQAWDLNTSGNTYKDMSNDVPASGESITIKYTIKNRIFR